MMKISSGSFKVADYQKDCFRLQVTGPFSGSDVEILRDEIQQCTSLGYDVVYVDLTGVTEIDLSGINEVINAHYTLDKVSKKLILMYKKGSVVEPWVETTGLEKYVATAIIPAT